MVITSSLTFRAGRDMGIEVNMVGGGGAGGLPVTQSALTLAGGGGGAGEARSIVFLTVLKDDNVVTVIGDGGTASDPDGKETSLAVVRNNQVVYQLRVAGGKGAVFDQGGEGGSQYSHSSLAGDPGTDGEALPSGENPNGGVGGASFFSRPSRGGTSTDPVGQPGEVGSGGGGSAPGTTDVAPGGKGQIILEF